MHQIRVHLAARGWPIVGDPKYGLPLWRDVEDGALREALASLPRQALHAWRLVFVHPMTGQRLALEAPYPPDLGRLLTAAGLA
jgi:23S rRNA-/tRNA-specific pseudouridylate synthase